MVFVFSYIFFFLPAHMPNFMLEAARFVPAKIVGGKDATLPIPWQVSVQNNSDHFCGATILDKMTLLSAASCFYGNSTNGISIRAGSVHKSDGGQVCLLFISQSLFVSWTLYGCNWNGPRTYLGPWLFWSSRNLVSTKFGSKEIWSPHLYHFMQGPILSGQKFSWDQICMSGAQMRFLKLFIS